MASPIVGPELREPCDLILFCLVQVSRCESSPLTSTSSMMMRARRRTLMRCGVWASMCGSTRSLKASRTLRWIILRTDDACQLGVCCCQYGTLRSPLGLWTGDSQGMLRKETMSCERKRGGGERGGKGQGQREGGRKELEVRTEASPECKMILQMMCTGSPDSLVWGTRLVVSLHLDLTQTCGHLHCRG